MTIQELIELTGAQDLTPDTDKSAEISCGYTCDLLSWVMAHGQAGMAWITVQTHMNVIAVASLMEMAAVIVPEGIEMEEASLEKAKEEGITVLASEKTAYELCALMAEKGLPGSPREACSLFVELHIHSCLSPCADDDMTPANICGMAHIKGLDAIAVTDHNTARNLPYVKEAADYYHLILLPGMEVTTREEVHLLGYFPTVEDALEAGEVFSSHLPKMPNRPKFFGNQYIMNTDDEIMGEEMRMLIGATDLDLTECTEIIRKRGGVAIPAHINRGSNGLLVNLGLMPQEPAYPVVEVARHMEIHPSIVKDRMVLYSSDAHQLGNIMEAEFDFPVERFSLGGLFDTLKNAR